MSPKKKRGPKLLASWIKDNGISLSEFASNTDCTKQTICAIKNGTFTPGLALAVRIEHVTEGRVPAISWVGDLDWPRQDVIYKTH